MSPRVMAFGISLVATLVVGGALFIGIPRWTGSRSSVNAVAAVPPPAAIPTGRKIKARLFYVSEDGLHLTAVEREIAYGEGTAEQAKEILEAQFAPVAEPLVSAVPTGTKLKALFVTEGGTAFVDLSPEVVSANTGGTINELLTAYTIVNALTSNLPALTSVQLLVDGKEVDTLAGHVDLRRPLAKNPAWVQEVPRGQ
jgi:spore germination protein GerM